jgi:endoglucanase
MKPLFLYIASLVTLNFYASEIVSVQVLTSKIIRVHFDDGFITYHGNGQNASQDVITTNPLNENLASIAASYSITSINDNNYSAAVSPVEVGRKSKGTEFSSFCQGWGYIPFFNDIGCTGGSPDHVKEHWVYLFLPTAMVTGKTYTISTSLATNGSNFTLTYNPVTSLSEAIHVNLVGYSSAAPQKFGYAYSWLGDKGGLNLWAYAGNAFHLIDSSTNLSVFSGSLNFRKDSVSSETGQWNTTPNENFNGATVFECDFSAFNTAGTYYLSIEGIGRSHAFDIKCDALRAPFVAIMQGIYQQRSGINLAGSFVQNRPAPHNVQQTPGFAGKLKYSSTTWCQASDADASATDKPLYDAGILGDLTDTWGWYQDAGDWDGYLHHLNVPTYLMFLYENNKLKFKDDEFGIPESGNLQPDILDEARWLIRFYKRLKDEMASKGWGSGGVGGSRIFGDLWGTDAAPNETGRGSWQDTTRTWVVSGEDAFATIWYSAVAAHYAYCLNNAGLTDVEGINWQNEAVSAYNWVQNHLPNSNDCHSYNFQKLRLYASASLFKLTGNTSYNTIYQSNFTALGITNSSADIDGEKGFGVWQYSTLPTPLTPNNATLAAGLGAIEATADNYLLRNELENRACRFGGNYWMPMLVGQATSPLINEGIMGYLILRNTNIAKANQYKRVMHNTADYFLGNNPLNTTWISGFGERSPKGIFHLDSWYNGTPTIRKGVIPYGPWRTEAGGPYGPWRNDWAAKTTYPNISQFPGHERWFDQRTSPLSCEFTLDQTNLFSAFLFGALTCDFPVSSAAISDDAKIFKPIIYPNPTNNVVTISSNVVLESSIILTNLTGVQFKMDLKNNQLQLDQLPKGVYLLKLESENNAIWVEKIVLL